MPKRGPLEGPLSTIRFSGYDEVPRYPISAQTSTEHENNTILLFILFGHSRLSSVTGGFRILRSDNA